MKPVFKITRNNEFTTLNVAGDLTVQFCEEFKDQLLLFSSEESDLRLSLALVTCMDVSSIQLVYALKKLAQLNQREFVIVFPVDSDVSELLIKTGLMKVLSDRPITMNLN